MKGIVAVAFLGAVLTGSYLVYANTQAVVEVVVTGKERITYGSGSEIRSKYLVFTETETFENTDSLFAGKFNSSDLYGYLRAGQACRFRVLASGFHSFRCTAM
ncbi:hypothetical protein HGG76_05925 [Ochrobactrum tritici]|uniref:Uncharacterized protein n=1 Tax=Brucella tritici TaxID=94626 RepID=A0A7X6FSD8_9HYPH|nr:hypothetical protein [Brucella tritici]